MRSPLCSIPAVSLLALALLGPSLASAQAGDPGDSPSEVEGPEQRAAGRPLSDEAELARVTNLYDAGRYEDCDRTLSALLDPKGSRPLTEPELIEQARIYKAACAIGSGRPDAADEPLRAALLANPQMRPPDSLVFPPPVVERFLRVREQLRDQISIEEQKMIEAARARAARIEKEAEQERARVTRLEARAMEEYVVYQNRRWIALIPFGVGQFQNRDAALGWVFLVSETALAATALTALLVPTYLNHEASQRRTSIDQPALTQTLDNWQTALEISSWGFVAVALGGVLEAQLSFVPEFSTVRQRPLPDELKKQRPRAQQSSVVPFATPLNGGAGVGMTLSF